MTLDDWDIDLVQRFLFTLGLFVLLESLGLGHPTCQDISTDHKEPTISDIQLAHERIIKERTAHSVTTQKTDISEPVSYAIDPEKSTATYCFDNKYYEMTTPYQGPRCVATSEGLSEKTQSMVKLELNQRGLTLTDDTGSSTDNASNCLRTDIKDDSSSEDISDVLDHAIEAQTQQPDEISTQDIATESIQITCTETGYKKTRTIKKSLSDYNAYDIEITNADITATVSLKNYRPLKEAITTQHPECELTEQEDKV